MGNGWQVIDSEMVVLCNGKSNSDSEIWVGKINGLFKMNHNYSVTPMNDVVESQIHYMYSKGDTLIILSDMLYVSFDDGVTFRRNSFPDIFLTTLIRDSMLMVGTYSGVYVSYDFGATWSKNNNGLIIGSTYYYCNSLVVRENVIYLGTQDALYMSSDSGESWKLMRFFNKQIKTVITTKSYILVFAEMDGVYVSNDNGLNWKRIFESSGNSRGMYLIDNYVYLPLYSYDGDSQIWKLSLDSLPPLANVPEINNEQNIASDYSLYPNPSNGEIIVRKNKMDYGKILYTIMNQLGEVLKLGIIEDNVESQAIQLQSLPDGLYIFSTEINGKKENTSFIIVK